jgi:hypothetical protein
MRAVPLSPLAGFVPDAVDVPDGEDEEGVVLAVAMPVSNAVAAVSAASAAAGRVSLAMVVMFGPPWDFAITVTGKGF